MKDIINNFLVKCGKNVPQEVFNEVAYLRHKAEMYDELAYNGYEEIGNGKYQVCCQAFISSYDCELNWGVTVFKKIGKEYKEIYHDHRVKKPDLKELLKQFEERVFE